ncbi:MAG: sigma 54-interacting transcriptional regulator [Deltaproteobacteria bacterium]|nr:sigma 54-interacting transcriptional regulator [Deltaproteobacteria bacterium]
MLRDFDDNEDTGGATRQGGDTRLHLTISVGGFVSTKPLPPDGELTIGRGASCEVPVNHVSVSRRHARLQLSPLAIIDDGSRNGTVVRGQRIPADVPTRFECGDVVQVGDAALVVQAVPVSASPRPVTDTPLVSPLDTELARSARSRSPFAVVQVATNGARPSDVLPILRSIMRFTDVIKGDGTGGFQMLLVDTSSEHATQAVTRLTHALQHRGITAQIGLARFPEDGVAAEQLIAHALEQLAREPDAPPTEMDRVRELVRQVASGDLSVLVTGETGSGKELCAEMIHRLSPRAAMPFVRFNCSALVETLVESELFGHEKGAFTGAQTAHEGLLETANGGTVCLDEIGELSLSVQAKLLRVLEERVVRRVGGTTGRKIDVRFVCATNRDLLEEVNAGRFRRDLYYRINGLRIVLPPLRERLDEIIPLARAFAARARPGMSVVFGEDTIEALLSHGWRGNVRELRNTIERAVLMSSGGVVRPSHLVLERSSPPRRDSALRDAYPTAPIERLSYETMPGGRVSYETMPGQQRPSAASLAIEVADLERKRIVEALEHFGGNQTHAARALGMSRSTLIARMEEYALRRPRKRD